MHVEVHASNELLHRDLVEQHDQRNDVALVRQIRLRIKQPLERIDVAVAHLIEVHQLLGAVDLDIAQVQLAAVLAADVPAAPAIAHLGLIGHQDRAFVGQLVPERIHIR